MAITPEVSRPRKFGQTSGFLGHQRPLPADEITIHDGIPVTTPPRTIFDCAALLSLRSLERMFHEAEVAQLRDPLSIPRLIQRYPRHRGVAKLRAVIGSMEPEGITRNEFEERFLALLDASGLPRPRFNATLHLRGRFFEPDCLWGPQRLIAELDGGEVHNTDDAFQSDRRRDRILLAEGYRTTRVTWHQPRGEPDEVIADLRDALSRRSTL